MLIEDLFHRFKVIPRWNDNSAFAQYWFGDKSCDVSRSCETKNIFDGVSALASAFFRIVRPLRAIRVWRGSKSHPGAVRPTTFLAPHVAGDAERAEKAPMKAGLQGDKLVLSGVEPRQFKSAFNGFGAAVAKKRLAQTAGSDMRNFFRQVGYRLNMVKIRRAVNKFIHLRFGSRNHLRIAMAGIYYGNARKTIEVFAAVHVGDDCPAGFLNHDRRDRLHKSSHHVVTVFLDGVRHFRFVFRLRLRVTQVASQLPFSRAPLAAHPG